MHNMLFEDSLHPSKRVDSKAVEDLDSVIIISYMLKRRLETDRSKVLFSNSSKNLLKEINKKDYTKLIIYYDLVYDNKRTVIRLINILDRIVTYNMTNIAIVPIHCIEWHCIKAFGTKCQLTNIAINCLDYKNTNIYFNNMNKAKATHEKFCKAVLGEVVDKKYLGTCKIVDYNISKEDEDALIKTLPMRFEMYVPGEKVIVKDFLRKRYEEFRKLIKCDKKDLSYLKDLSRLKDLVDKYLCILDF